MWTVALANYMTKRQKASGVGGSCSLNGEQVVLILFPKYILNNEVDEVPNQDAKMRNWLEAGGAGSLSGLCNRNEGSPWTEDVDCTWICCVRNMILCSGALLNELWIEFAFMSASVFGDNLNSTFYFFNSFLFFGSKIKII